MGPPKPARRAKSLLKSKRLNLKVGRSRPSASHPSSSKVMGGRVVVGCWKRRPSMSLTTSTTRLGRSARAEFTSAAGRSNLIPTVTTAVTRSRARVGGFTWVKKCSDTCSGRLLHRSYLQGPRAKGSGVVDRRCDGAIRRVVCREAALLWAQAVCV